MMKSQSSETARILQFPLGGKAGLKPVIKPNEDTESQNVCEAASGSSWYHEAAVRDAEPARER